MGIYDRDYYRREGPSFLGSLTERGTVCKWLIGINVVCFIVQMVTTSPSQHHALSPFTEALWLDVSEVLNGQVWRLLTYAFLHDTGSLWHILVNMLILFFFGRDVEDAIGPREFLVAYLTAAVLGGLAFVGTEELFRTGAPCIGASGAVMAILVMAACRHPHRRILLFFVLPVPIWLVVVLMVAGDLFGFLGRSSDKVAVQVHLAGAAFGGLHFLFGWRLSGWLPGSPTRWSRAARPNLRLYREEMQEEDRASAGASTSTSVQAVPWPVAVSPQDDEQLEAKMDAILEKISRAGKDSLTESEWHILQKASERLRRRRG